MLKQRVISAIVLIALLLSALFNLSFQHFALVLAVLFVVGAWEWANLAKLNMVLRVLYSLCVLALMYFCWRWLGFGRAFNLGMEEKLQWVLIFTAFFWAVAVYWIVTFPSSLSQWCKPLIQLLIGFVVLVPAWLALVFLSSQLHGEWLIVIAAMTVVCADTGAYFAGRKWGKRKLAADVSPGKTLEGFFGGVLVSVLFAAVLALVLGRGFYDGWLLLIVVASSLISVFGDLFESMLKRHRGIKDSGILLPGHGGILDRIDSITAAAPVFALLCILSGWGL